MLNLSTGFLIKKSHFTTEIEISEGTSILYNTLSRKFYEFKNDNRGQIYKMLADISKGMYSKEDDHIIREWAEKGLIVKDDAEELVELISAQNKIRFNNTCINLTIIVTNDCNFRCVHCNQEHIKGRLNEKSIRKIYKFIDRITVGKRQLNVSWFGGEPTLEYKRIARMSEKLKDICTENGCTYIANITTNGYLLNRDRVENMLAMNINRIQLTLDADKATHDSMRVLVGNRPTYDVILNNFLSSLDTDMQWVLRINVNEKNANKAHEILERIPSEYRQKVIINFCNLFQEQGKNNLFELYKQAIEMGYVYDDREQFAACEACRINGYFINADGKLLLCPNAAEEDKEIGCLDNEGYPHYIKNEWNERLRISTGIPEKKCRECVELPFCINKCPYGQCKSNKKGCQSNDGLTYIERAKLDYVKVQHGRNT